MLRRFDRTGQRVHTLLGALVVGGDAVAVLLEMVFPGNGRVLLDENARVLAVAVAIPAAAAANGSHADTLSAQWRLRVRPPPNMTPMQTAAIRGTASGVPYIATGPAGGDPAAPVVVIWHLMDSPRTEVAMAAALPLSGVEAWRVYFGLPMAGARVPAGGVEQILAWIREDTLRKGIGAAITEAAAEFPAALGAVRDQLRLAADSPVVVVGGSAGGATALLTLAEAAKSDAGQQIIGAVAINAAIRAESVVALTEQLFQVTYTWSEASREVAARLNFVDRAAELGGRPLLIVSGEEDHADFQADAAALRDAVGAGAELAKVPGLAHPLALEPGLEPAPQTPAAKVVDALVSGWLSRLFKN